MSLSNLIFDKIIKNDCNHVQDQSNKASNNKKYFYCYKCNNIILIMNNKFYSTYKLIDDEDINNKIEFDPILIVKLMINRQEEQIKDINEKLVLNFSNHDETNTNQINSNLLSESEKINHSGITNIEEAENIEKEKIKNIKSFGSNLISTKNSVARNEKKNNKFTELLFDEETFEKYKNQRNRVMIYIHKLCTKLKYNDGTFYLTLYLADTYLSRIFSEEITEKELFLIILGFFLISSKYIEDDIFEPELQTFCNIEKNITLSVEEIRASEVLCLTLINYNLFLYSTFDWLNILLDNGILFETEIKDKNEFGNIYIYTQKLLTLITSKIYFCKYSSIQIAFSIIHLSREKYLKNNSEISELLLKLLFSLYGVDFSDYEECYNTIKLDLSENNEDEDEDGKSHLNSNTSSKCSIKSNMKSTEIKLNKNNHKIFNDEIKISNLNSSGRANRFKIFLNSNKGKKIINTDFNIKLINNNSNSNNKYKLYSSPGQINFLNYKNKNKSTNKNLEFSQNNSIGLFDNKGNKNLSPNIMNHKNNILNNSFKSSNYIPKEKQQYNVDSYRNDKQLILSRKSQKSNNNTLYINYAPKFLIKTTGPNVNNINYINNININNEIINVYTEPGKKKINDNILSGLNLNFCNKIDDNFHTINNKENKNNNYIIKKTSFTINNSNNNQINYEYNINSMKNNNINNMEINNQIKKDNNINFTNTQNIIKIKNNTSNNNKKIDLNKKEKYKTLLLFDFQNNKNLNNLFKRNGENEVIIPPEKENKSCNKYSFNGYTNSINNNKKKKNIRIHLGENKKIKIMNTNININVNNKISNRKFTIDFKDIVNKKINMEKTNNYVAKDKNSNNKRFKSHNSNKYTLNYETYKAHQKFNNYEHKSKNGKVKVFHEFKNKTNYKLIEDNIRIGNNIININNIDAIDSRLPSLKFNKKSILYGK